MGVEIEYLDYFTSKAGLDKMVFKIENKFKGKDIPKQTKDALEVLKTTLGVINYLYSNLDKELKESDRLDKEVSKLAFTNGLLNREVEKLKRINERLIKTSKL